MGEAGAREAVDQGRWLQRLQARLAELRPHVREEGLPLLERLASELQQALARLPQPDVVDISEVRGEDLPPRGGEGEWKMLGRGAFGVVFRVTFQGNPSAVKIFKAGLDSRVKESDILRGLSHDNIIAYRGTGVVTSGSLRERIGEDMGKLTDDESGVGEEEKGEGGTQDENVVYRFLIMEFLPKNLETFVQMSFSEKSKMKKRGLPDEQTCVIGEKMANALAYLHSKNIAHRDLKPDNVLIDPARRTVKLADFGLARHQDARMLLDRRTGSKTSSVKHARWSAPELFQTSAEQSQADRQRRYEQGDIWSLAMVLVFCITRKKPLENFAQSGDIHPSSITTEEITLPSDLPPDLRSVVEGCRDKDPLLRPSASSVAATLLKLHGDLEVPEYEFFTCGFLKKTEIFVADSCVAEDSVGCLALGTRGEGYDHKYLLCPVDTDPSNLYPIPEEWDLEDSYFQAFSRLQEQADKKIIDDNPAVALKGLTVARPGKDELQLLELRYQQTTYCHHRAMREMWMKELSDADRRREIPCLATVHPYFSTSFGLHLAVLTNEKPGRDKKFIFCRRAQRPGMSSPGAITCGAVESCSVNDFEGGAGARRVSLVRTAARGLHEELGVELQGSDLEAVTLQTVYLKYDTHEWGMCGYVDLSDDRIHPSRRLSAEQIKSLFTGGPKDKFEHESVSFVDFTLDKMADFVFENQDTFASSAKLVVVKVLQTFFGVEPVQRKFQMYSAN